MTSLVPYSDSDDDADEANATVIPQIAPKRKLASFRDDEPSSKKGKVHTSLGISASSPVKGDWLCYCFLPVDQQAEVSEVMRQALSLLRSQYDQLETVSEPHISLTKPILIRYHEKDDLLAKTEEAVKAFSRRSNRSAKIISLAFSAFAQLPSEDGSRIYWAVEIGLGWQELQSLTSSLDSHLASFHAREYFKEARFHSSFAWLGSEDVNDEQLKDISRLLESTLGDQLRACQAIFVDKIGVATGSQKHYVEV